MKKRRPSPPFRLPDLEEPVASLAADEGLVFVRGGTGLRILTFVRAGTDNPAGNAGEGTSQT